MVIRSSFTARKATGQFELVSDPSDADLVLELQLIAPNGLLGVNKQNGASDPVPMFRLVVYDRKTHYILWALTQSIGVAILQKTHDRNFDEALTNILFEFQQLADKLPTPPHKADPFVREKDVKSRARSSRPKPLKTRAKMVCHVLQIIFPIGLSWIYMA